MIWQWGKGLRLIIIQLPTSGCTTLARLAPLICGVPQSWGRNLSADACMAKHPKHKALTPVAVAKTLAG